MKVMILIDLKTLLSMHILISNETNAEFISPRLVEET